MSTHDDSVTLNSVGWRLVKMLGLVSDGDFSIEVEWEDLLNTVESRLKDSWREGAEVGYRTGYRDSHEGWAYQPEPANPFTKERFPA